MAPIDRAREVIQIEIQALQALMEGLDTPFNTAVQWLVETVSSHRKCIVLGIGKSGLIGRKIAATLTSTGCPSIVLDPVDALHGDVGIVTDGDLVLALSYSGESDELIHLLPALRQFSIRIIALTGAPDSTLARHSHLVLSTRVPREACPFNLAPTASTTATLVLGDALAMALLQARGFQTEDFARRHPAGSIGRSLLLRVRDIMRQGDRNALASPGTRVQDALLLMTRAKSGSVAVVDAQGVLVGVFTDGDLRRRMAVSTAVLEQVLGDVMTRNPVTIPESALAAEALRLFKEKPIDDLIVVNDQGQPTGMIDIQDLPKLKLVG